MVDLTAFSYHLVPGVSSVLTEHVLSDAGGEASGLFWFGAGEGWLGGEGSLATVRGSGPHLDLPPPPLFQCLQPHSEATQLAL